MARTNIFEKISSKVDFAREAQRLLCLIRNSEGVIFSTEQPNPYGFVLEQRLTSIEKFVDQYTFKTWKARATCLDLNDFATTIGITEISQKSDLSVEDLLDLSEYVANLLFLVKQAESLGYVQLDESEIYTTAKNNLDTLLGWLNHEQKVFPDEERVLVVQKDAAATAVAEISPQKLAFLIVKYHHYTLKGNIAEKKSILLALGNELEPKREKLTSINRKLINDIFFMLNNLDLRHNNRTVGDKNYKENVANMSDSELEDWYDELYQMILLAMLELDQQERSERVKHLKETIQ